MKELLKTIAEKIPYPLAKALALTPMSLRLGRHYTNYSKMAGFEAPSLAEQIKRIGALVRFASKETSFYKNFYEEHGFHKQNISSFNDFIKIPIVTKSDFKKVQLGHRSVHRFALRKSNTGGTTGQPLDFFIEKSAYAREWAHMHAVWAKLGYHYTDEKLTIRGKNIGNSFYKYSFNQNEFLINAYMPLENNLVACRDLIAKRDIKWIHGYPSSIYSFLRELESVDSVLFEHLLTKIKGVFLGSEYPAPLYRHYIEKHCGLKSISWYGHSEMAVLAPEREPGSGVYYPFYSYGFAEAVKDGDSYRLIATSTHNFASPFIRYDTGDFIEPTFKDGLLECFRIKEGRNSDSVIDKNGRSISLTGLIFGRHHKAFDHCEHVQVRQSISGKVEILVTSKAAFDNWADLFDFSNAFFDVSFTQLESPITTPAGKVQLLVR